MPINQLRVIDSDSLLRLHYKISKSPRELLKSTSEVQPFKYIAETFDLKLTDTTYQFDDGHKLALPKSKSWRGENNNGDRENCATIFKALPGLTATEATDERLWVSLCFNQFNDYANARWPLVLSKDPKIQDEALSGALFSHRFAGTTRTRWRDNAVSRLWWMAYYAHSFNDLDADSVLDILCLDSDLVGTLLGRPWTSNNRVVTSCLLKELQNEYLGSGAPEFNRDKFRQTLKELDLRAGKYVLAALGDKKIEDLVSSVFATHHGK
jgi:hypothetical protein